MNEYIVNMYFHFTQLYAKENFATFARIVKVEKVSTSPTNLE